MADVPVPGFRKYWTQKLASEAASVVQQVHKVLSDIEILAGCTRSKVGESSPWTAVVKENRANLCIGLHGKPLFSAPYGMYTVTLN
jgi:hypothetical protein